MALAGGCGCGAVRFEVTAPLVSANYCHCTRCQRRSGTAASANARAEPGSFRILSGEESLRAWRPAGGFEKWFCGDCGSALFSRHPHDPEQVSIRLGAPNYPDCTMTLTGSVTAKGPLGDDGRSGTVTVAIRGANDLGDHVTGTVDVVLPLGDESSSGRD